MHCSKSGNSSKRNCSRCLVQTTGLEAFRHEHMRSLTYTKTLISSVSKLLDQSNLEESRGDLKLLKSLKKEVQEILQEYSTTFKLLALKNQSISSKKPLDIYSIFQFEPMHNLCLGITQMVLCLFYCRTKACSTKYTAIMNFCIVFLIGTERFTSALDCVSI